MSRSSPVVRLLDGLLELGWLFILLAVPVFFNVRDGRIFEPDKVVLVRNTVLAMVVVFLLKACYLAPQYLTRWFGAGATPRSASLVAELSTALRRRPVAIFALIFALVYVLATLTSILPRISFWGSYDRLEGTYTYLSYITLFLLITSHLRSWPQVERLVSAVILASVPAAAYSWLQHFKADPMVWGDPVQVALRTPSTLGNPIFLAAFLLMAVPFTLYRLVLRVEQVLRAQPNGRQASAEVWAAVGTVGYGAALCLQLGAIGFSGSRGPALGLLAALIVFIGCLALRRHVRWLLRCTVALAVVLVLVFGATNVVQKGANTPHGGFSRFLYLLPSESGSSEVRSLLWKSAPGLLAQHPVLGCGPEVLLFCWYPHYPSALRTVELANAAPDRSHNEDIDVVLTTGIIGAVAYLALILSALLVLAQLVRRARDPRAITLACALLAAFVGHLVEGFTGIAFSATLVMLWTIAAVGTALEAGGVRGAAASFAPAQAGDVPVTAPPAAPERADRGGRGAGAAAGVRKGQQPRGGREGGRGAAARRGADRGARYRFGDALSHLGGGALGALVLGTLASLALIVGCCVLFVTNIQYILAGVDFQQGLNLETAAGNVLSAASVSSQDYQTGLLGYQESIAAYQNALAADPGEDNYALNLGKTYLEYAGALLSNKSTPRADVVAQIQNALDVFQKAARNNPLNPDHPRNIAKLYQFWGAQAFSTVDLAKLKLANQYFARAHSLAPHNVDILDEWALLDQQLGLNDTLHAHQWWADDLAHLEAGRALVPDDGNIYRDLGPVYEQYALWAQARKDTASAGKYLRLEEQAWLTALKYAATSYQKLYPRLAHLYLYELHEPCPAATYANFGLQAIQAGTLLDPDNSLKAGMQQIVANGVAQHCPAAAP